LIGPSGDGKSTLLNYIGGAQQVAIDDDGRYKIENVKPLPGIITGHGLESETKLPCRYKNFYDCPGFGDTRGPIQEILNIFSIHKLTERSQKIKVIITISEYSIRQGRGEIFVKTVKNLGETFQNIN
jgi:hypothetical protein